MQILAYFPTKRKEDFTMKKRYIKEIISIIHQIDSPVILMKILTVAKTHLAILQEKGGVEQ